MGLLKDKIALITGASRGIGRGIAAVFAKNGCSVAFTYNNNKEMADSLEKELAVYNIKTKSYKIDVSKLSPGFYMIAVLMNNHHFQISRFQKI